MCRWSRRPDQTLPCWGTHPAWRPTATSCAHHVPHALPLVRADHEDMSVVRLFAFEEGVLWVHMRPERARRAHKSSSLKWTWTGSHDPRTRRTRRTHARAHARSAQHSSERTRGTACGPSAFEEGVLWVHMRPQRARRAHKSSSLKWTWTGSERIAHAPPVADDVIGAACSRRDRCCPFMCS
jgi:hypothetical protein